MIDLVYVLRPGLNEELRYSLRSVCENLPHMQVWIVGPERPDWVSPLVRHIRTTEGARANKWRQIPAAISAAAAKFEVAEDIVLMNDDFYVMGPWTPVPLHRGELRDFRDRTDTYGRGYTETAYFLESLGIQPPHLNYELHLPFPMYKPRLHEAMRRAYDQRNGFKGRCLHTRTFYGNFWRVDGERAEDVKVHGPESVRYLKGRTLLSTNDTSFGGYPVGKFIRQAFPEPCRYEKETRG